ncbi:MAG TPA: M15 family metallopeptidase [Patescibacteria group bacterium]|nr:M15 family metallopeptidase [Patescibacteria group bacterium]
MRPRVRHGALAAALALLVLACVHTALAPSDVRGLGALPACRYDDIMTTPRGYDDWSTTLVDTILRLPRSYVPPDLVSVSQAGIAGHGRIRAIAIDDLRAMTEVAAAAGNAIGVESAYRSYADQVSTFNHWVATSGYAAALTYSARPGHSEHQLGLAIDFRSDPGGSPFTGSWGQTPAGKWMRLHAWEYGFIRSYSPKEQAVTCYASEAWHYRYVGRDLAAAIHASGLTTREYLWANFTTAVVPRVTPRPTKAPAGSAAPPESAEPSASAPAASEAPGAEATPVVAPGTAEVPEGTAAAGGPPRQTPPPVELSPVADLDPGVATGLIVALGAILGVTLLVLRRGRSGVGL